MIKVKDTNYYFSVDESAIGWYFSKFGCYPENRFHATSGHKSEYFETEILKLLNETLYDYLTPISREVGYVRNTNTDFKYHESIYSYGWINEKDKVVIQYVGGALYVIYFRITPTIEKLIEDIKIITRESSKMDPEKKCKIYLLQKNDYSGFNLIQAELKDTTELSKENYSQNVVDAWDHIIDKLSTDHGEGVLLLHGEPGTGKTTFIRYLTHMIDKKFITIPVNLVDKLSDPSFIKFLIDNRGSILVIEEAERAIANRNDSSYSSVGELLSISDGLLGDIVNMKVILTFNTTRSQIDKALLRKGRLIADCEFSKLPIEQANNLLNKLGKDYITTQPMTVADIYNINTVAYTATKPFEKIGFKTT